MRHSLHAVVIPSAQWRRATVETMVPMRPRGYAGGHAATGHTGTGTGTGTDTDTDTTMRSQTHKQRDYGTMRP